MATTSSSLNPYCYVTAAAVHAPSRMDLNVVTDKIISCAMKIHRDLGPGLLESAYESCLENRLTNDGLDVRRQKRLPLIYAGVKTNQGYRIDLLVEKLVIVEVKAAKRVDLIVNAQMRTYLKLSRCPVGLIINFNVLWLKNGIYRIMNPDV